MNLNIDWVKAAVIRAVKTICQAAVSMIVIGQPIFDIDWKSIVTISLTAGVVSILTSLAGLPEVDK